MRRCIDFIITLIWIISSVKKTNTSCAPKHVKTVPQWNALKWHPLLFPEESLIVGAHTRHSADSKEFYKKNSQLYLCTTIYHSGRLWKGKYACFHLSLWRRSPECTDVNCHQLWTEFNENLRLWGTFVETKEIITLQCNEPWRTIREGIEYGNLEYFQNRIYFVAASTSHNWYGMSSTSY